MKTRHSPSSNAGFTLLEALISMLVIALGLLGLAGLQVRMQQAEFESYQRSQALILLYDMVDRIQSNRSTAACFALTTDAAAGTPYVGAGANPPTGCTASTSANNTLADNLIAEWDGLLEGAAVTSGGASVGAIIGARGCVSYDSLTEVPDTAGAPISGTGIYTVAIAWQGTIDTFAPVNNCAKDLYGAETQRRVVATGFRIAKLD